MSRRARGSPSRRISLLKAKHVIFLFLNGGLSHIDSFDRKPMLDKYDGQPLPYETPQTEFATGNLMKSPFSFKRYGQSGIEVSELFPMIGEMIDDFSSSARCKPTSQITVRRC